MRQSSYLSNQILLLNKIIIPKHKILLILYHLDENTLYILIHNDVKWAQ